MTQAEQIPDLIESKLSDIARRIAEQYNSSDFIVNPDFLEERSRRWHQFGLVEHSKRVRAFFKTGLDNFLKRISRQREFEAYFSREVEGVKIKTLFEISILLHDLGKIVACAKNAGKPEEFDRAHEDYSRGLIEDGLVGQILTKFGIKEEQKRYIAGCAGSHVVLSKELRDKLRARNKYSLSGISSPEVLEACTEIAARHFPYRAEIGLFYLCDSEGKLDIFIGAESDEEVARQEDSVVALLKQKGLPLELKSGIMHMPINLKLAEIYLKNVF
jgi:hypothetical protein